MKVGEELGDLDIQGMGALHLGEIHSFRGEFDEAQRWLDQAEQWAKFSNNPKIVTGVLSRRGAVAIRQQDWVKAKTLLNQVLEMNIALGERRFIAYNKLDLAEVYLATDRLAAAKQMADEARDVAEALGMEALQVRADDLAHIINRRLYASKMTR